MQLYADAFEEWCDPGMKFRKFHVTIHYQAFIERYGVPALSYAGWWEKAMRFLVKVPYLRTGRRLKGMYTNLMKRIAFMEVVAKKKAALEREEPWGDIVMAAGDPRVRQEDLEAVPHQRSHH